MALIRLISIAALAISVVFAQEEATTELAKLEASKCDVSVFRSASGALTKIQVGDNLALIEMKDDESWSAYTKNNDEIKEITLEPRPFFMSSSSTEAPKLDLDNKLEDESETITTAQPSVSANDDESTKNKAHLDELLAKQFDGAQFSFDSGKLTIESTNGQKAALKTPTQTAQVMVYGDCKSKTVAALNLKDQTVGYTHVFKQNGTVVIFVDQECKVSAVKYDELNNVQSRLMDTINNQTMIDNRHGHDHHNHPRPPPPPFGGFFQRFNPMNRFFSDFPGPQPQQFGNRQPNQQFNMAPPPQQQQQFNMAPPQQQPIGPMI